MAKIIIPQKKTATLELQLDGEDISIQFPVDSMAGYRQTTEVVKGYRELADKQKAFGDEKLSDEQTAEILDQCVGLMESFRNAVKVAIRDEAYNKYLRSVEDDIPFTAWVEILNEIISKYAEYFGKVTSTEGEL
jgi:hypothetical protein